MGDKVLDLYQLISSYKDYTFEKAVEERLDKVMGRYLFEIECATNRLIYDKYKVYKELGK